MAQVRYATPDEDKCIVLVTLHGHVIARKTTSEVLAITDNLSVE